MYYRAITFTQCINDASDVDWQICVYNNTQQLQLLVYIAKIPGVIFSHHKHTRYHIFLYKPPPGLTYMPSLGQRPGFVLIEASGFILGIYGLYVFLLYSYVLYSIWVIVKCTVLIVNRHLPNFN